MTPHASNEGTPRTQAEYDRLVSIPGNNSMWDVAQGLYNFVRTLERENQSLARRVGELEVALRELLANGGPLSDPVSRKQANSRARTTLNQGDQP